MIALVIVAKSVSSGGSARRCGGLPLGDPPYETAPERCSRRSQSRALSPFKNESIDRAHLLRSARSTSNRALRCRRHATSTLIDPARRHHAPPHHEGVHQRVLRGVHGIRRTCRSEDGSTPADHGRRGDLRSLSTKERTENLSLPTQLRACGEYCRQGYEVIERFREEGESASAQMPLRECAAGTRFQVALERQRPCFVPERDHEVECPRPIALCVDTLARVMTGEPHPYIRSDAGVVAVSIAEAPEHVHEPFRSQHAGVGGQSSCRPPCRTNQEVTATADANGQPQLSRAVVKPVLLRAARYGGHHPSRIGALALSGKPPR